MNDCVICTLHTQLLLFRFHDSNPEFTDKLRRSLHHTRALWCLYGKWLVCTWESCHFLKPFKQELMRTNQQKMSK